MQKAAIIGLGDIAKKAYLPVLSARSNLQIHLCTRNKVTLEELGVKYKIPHLFSSLHALVESRPDCAFVNAATDAHYEIVKFLLEHQIAVFVDKPITMHYSLSKELVELAENKKTLLMVGFNRRYAPAYQHLKETQDPSMVIVQKNRKGLPDEIRRFVVEDFVHVVDTMRYLFPYPIEKMLVNGMKRGNLLHHLTVQFNGTGRTNCFGHHEQGWRGIRREGRSFFPRRQEDSGQRLRLFSPKQPGYDPLWRKRLALHLVQKRV